MQVYHFTIPDAHLTSLRSTMKKLGDFRLAQIQEAVEKLGYPERAEVNGSRFQEFVSSRIAGRFIEREKRHGNLEKVSGVLWRYVGA